MGVLALVGAGVAAAGQLFAGEAAAQQYEYNAAVARMEGDYAAKRSEIEARQHEENIRRLVGRHRAMTGASGTVSDVGSNLAGLIDIEQQGAIDAALIRYEGSLGRWRGESQRDILQAGARSTRVGSYLGAGSTILGAASEFDWKRTPKAVPPPYPTGSTKKLFY